MNLSKALVRVAILGMTGMSDANGFISVIIDQGRREENPRWTWGGID